MRRSSSLTPDIRWDTRSARYTDANTGRFVSAARVRQVLDSTLDRAERSIKKATEALRAGRVDLATWQTLMAKEVKSVHLASAALAKGGWAQMTPSTYGAVGARVRGEYAYLRAFAAEVASGAQRLDGTLARRAGLYVQAGRGTYHRVERAEQLRRGRTFERNVLHARDNCIGCLEQTARGWVAIGALVPIGSRDCLTRCRCSVEYRTGEIANAD